MRQVRQPLLFVQGCGFSPRPVEDSRLHGNLNPHPLKNRKGWGIKNARRKADCHAEPKQRYFFLLSSSYTTSVKVGGW